MSKKQRIKDKIELVASYNNYLYKIFPKNIKDYKENLTIKAACERYFEKILEAYTDIAFLFAREKGFELPEDEDSIFYILTKNKIISEKLAENIRSAKGMRNVIAHQYGEIDDEKVFNSTEQELEKDIEEFLNKVKSNL